MRSDAYHKIDDRFQRQNPAYSLSCTKHPSRGVCVFCMVAGEYCALIYLQADASPC